MVLQWLAVLVLAGADDFCVKCKSSGRLPVPDHDELLEDEGVVELCSVVVDDEGLYHGMDFSPCVKCRMPELAAQAQQEYDSLVKARLDWLEQAREVDRYIDDRDLEMLHCRTAHFDLDWSIPRWKVGKKTLDMHESMHLYAERLEAFYQEYLEFFGIDHRRDQKGERHRIMVFHRAKHGLRAQPKFTGIGGSNSSGSKLMGKPSVFVFYLDKTKHRDDEDLHEYVMHNAVHLFVTVLHNYAWLGRDHGWIDAGLAHYFTQKHFGESRTHCYQEMNETHRWIFGDWRVAARKMVQARDPFQFAEVIQKATTAMTVEEHVLSFSWVEFLLTKYGAEKFLKMVRQLKEKKELRDVLRDVYDFSLLSFPDHWAEYVKDEYPLK